MSGAKPEMQKAADTTDMSVLFFQMVLIFGKATHKTMQTLVLAASLGSSEMMLSPIKSAPLLDFASATNTSAISNSTGAISTSAMGFYHDGKQGRLHGHLQPRV